MRKGYKSLVLEEGLYFAGSFAWLKIMSTTSNFDFKYGCLLLFSTFSPSLALQPFSWSSFASIIILHCSLSSLTSNAVHRHLSMLVTLHFFSRAFRNSRYQDITTNRRTHVQVMTFRCMSTRCSDRVNASHSLPLGSYSSASALPFSALVSEGRCSRKPERERDKRWCWSSE